MKKPLESLLPNLCSTPSVLGLVLVGELLAVVLVLVQAPLSHFSWAVLGVMSLLVQWIVLLSAALLCQLSNSLNRASAVKGGLAAYGLVLLISLIVLIMAQWFLYRFLVPAELFKNMLIAAIVAGIMLRFLYIQQQLRVQQQAELQARIASLHARIRPHFFFNTLNAVASLIPVKPGQAERMIEDLSQLFRASLKEPHLVPLSEEIDICRRYIAIEQIRLGDRLSVVWEDSLDGSGDSYSLPSLILQPVIENAIYHGIQRLPEGGEVTIKIKMLDDQLLIHVINPLPVLSDTGTDKLPELKGNQMAIDNIRHRLQAHYEGNARLETRENSNFYEVILSLPTEITDV